MLSLGLIPQLDVTSGAPMSGGRHIKSGGVMDRELEAFFVRWQNTWSRIEQGVLDDLSLIAQEPGMDKSIPFIRLERKLKMILKRMRLQIDVTEQLMNDLVRARVDTDYTAAR